jgi:hypothetical protein
MKANEKSSEPKKLPRKALEASRKGVLGRFPPPELYEPDPDIAPRPPAGRKQNRAAKAK